MARAAQVIDGKWTTLIVRELLGGPRRFSELQRGIAGGGDEAGSAISPRLLTARLRLLEEEGVLQRTVWATQPPSTEYALTAHGQGLLAVIQAMATFGQAAQARDAQAQAAAEAQRAEQARRTAGVRVHRLR